jgi:hypothetical protein
MNIAHDATQRAVDLIPMPFAMDQATINHQFSIPTRLGLHHSPLYVDLRALKYLRNDVAISWNSSGICLILNHILIAFSGQPVRQCVLE